MGFYARGGGNTVLHLTEKSDARGGVTTDTIFHSSMPHIFIEQEWEISLSNQPSGVTQSTSPDPRVREANFLPRMRVADIPAGVIFAIQDPSTVLITEVFFTKGGKEYSKVINGWTLNSSYEIADQYNWENEYWNYSIQINSQLQVGTDVNLGYFGGGKNSNTRKKVSSPKETFGLVSTEIFSASYTYGTGDMEETSIRGIYNSNLGTPYATIPVSTLPASSFQGNHYSSVLVFPTSFLVGGPAPQWFTNSRDDVENKVFDKNTRLNSYSENRVTVTHIMNPTRGKGVWSREPEYLNNANYGELGEWKDVVFTKIRWRKLNISYNRNTGYSIRNAVPLTGEIRINSNDFRVGGTSIQSLGKKMLHQIDGSKVDPRYTRMLTNSVYGTNTIPTGITRPIFQPKGINIDKSIGTIDSTAGQVIPSKGERYIGIVDFSGAKGWFCSPDQIGYNGMGVVWGRGGNLPLRIISPTQRIKFGGNTIELLDNQMKVLGTINAGLSTTRDSTVIFQMSTSDIALHLSGPGYYNPFDKSKDFKLNTNSGNMDEVTSDHNIMVLPINQYVPFIVGRDTRTHYNVSMNSVDRLACALNTYIYWLKNLGNGNIEVSISRREVGVYGYKTDPLNYTPKYYKLRVPEIYFSIVKLS